MILIINYKVQWEHFHLSSFQAFFHVFSEEYMKQPQPQPIEAVSMLMIKVFIEGNFS